MEMKMEHVTKVIGGREILSDIHLTFTSGHIYGLTGHNGSGKTMLLRALSGLIHPTEGYVTVGGKTLGRDISFPQDMGLLIENPELLGYLSGLDNLKLLAEIRHTATEETIRRYMNLFSLDPDSRQKVRKYSLGMKQKLGIIQALMEEPQLLILDEPFNALDRDSVDVLKNLLLQYQSEGRLVILTSHHREEIDAICDPVIRMEEGRCV